LLIEYIDNPCQDTYQEYVEYDMSCAKEKLGFEPRFTLEDGVSDYFKSGWLLK